MGGLLESTCGMPTYTQSSMCKTIRLKVALLVHFSSGSQEACERESSLETYFNVLTVKENLLIVIGGKKMSLWVLYSDQGFVHINLLQVY